MNAKIITLPVVRVERHEDDDCEDQGGMATDVCVKHGCDNALLELRGSNWCCSNCGASYGEDARGPHTTSQRAEK